MKKLTRRLVFANFIFNLLILFMIVHYNEKN